VISRSRQKTRTTCSCRSPWPGRSSSAWRGPNSELRVLEGMRHEVFNELGEEEVIDLVASFAERVTTH
jgi:alpha-beta hydrolase superfamily lysophospholipase